MKLAIKKNIIYLYINQILTYVFPLITLPILVAKLNTDGFGKLSFSLALIGYFLLIVDYGFNISASRKIAQHKNNDFKRTEIFILTILSKLLLVIISAIFLLIVTLTTPKLNANIDLHWLVFLSSIGLALFPQWYFQGVERMGNITIVNSISKALYTIFIILFIKEKSDLNLAGFFYGISFLIPGVISFIIAYKEQKGTIYLFFKTLKAKANWIKVLFKSVVSELIDGRHIFLSTILSSILLTTSIFLLGIFHSDEIVGGYAANDKLIKALLFLFSPITNAIFPNISYELSISEKNGIKSIYRYGIPTVIMSILISIFTIVFSEQILTIFFNSEVLKFRSVFIILSLWIPFSVLNNFIGIQYLCGSGKSKIYGKSFTMSGLITLTLMIIATKLFSYNGTALSVLAGELLLTLFMIINIKRIK